MRYPQRRSDLPHGGGVSSVSSQHTKEESILDRTDIADEWVGGLVFVILRESNGEPRKNVYIKWLEGVDHDGIRCKGAHYVEPARRYSKAADEEFYPWDDLWHVQDANFLQNR